jgi:hypothetical protein
MYTVQLTVKVAAASEHAAYRFLLHAIAHAKLAELVYVDAEVIREDRDDELGTDDAEA